MGRPPVKASIDLELNREHEYLLGPPRTTKQPETSKFAAYEHPNIENKHKDQQKKTGNSFESTIHQYPRHPNTC